MEVRIYIVSQIRLLPKQRWSYGKALCIYVFSNHYNIIIAIYGVADVLGKGDN